MPLGKINDYRGSQTMHSASGRGSTQTLGCHGEEIEPRGNATFLPLAVLLHDLGTLPVHKSVTSFRIRLELPPTLLSHSPGPDIKPSILVL